MGTMHELPDAIDRLAKRRWKRWKRRVEAVGASARSALAACLQRETESAAAAPVAAAMPIRAARQHFLRVGQGPAGHCRRVRVARRRGSQLLPKLAVASAGIAYAFLWLVWAARTRGGPRFTSTIYACTSALILAPMLWELTLAFDVLPAAVAAAAVWRALRIAAIGARRGSARTRRRCCE